MTAKNSDIKTEIGRVIVRAHVIEQLLRTHYSIPSCGLKKVSEELADSIPAIMTRAIRIIADVRNSAAHPVNFTHGSVPDDFDRLCDEIELLIPYFAAKRASKAEAAPTKPITSPGEANAPVRDLDAILKRLAKLKPTKRAKAINSIKAMFHQAELMSDDEASKILEALQKRGSISIDANEKIEFNNGHLPKEINPPAAKPKVTNPAPKPPENGMEMVKPAKHGKPWTPEEDEKLIDAFDAQIAMPELAKAHQRGIGSVQARLIKLGRMTRDQYKTYPLESQIDKIA